MPEARWHLRTEPKTKKVRFDMGSTEIIEFKVKKQMKKVNCKNLLDYADVRKIDGKNKLNNVDITEIYSPPRVNQHAARMGLRPGDSMDLVIG